MRIQKIGLLVMLCAIATDAALAQLAPEFPKSELNRGHEGWVVLNYTIADDGDILDLNVEESSGNDNFDEAALAAAREWHFDATAERQSRVLINFVFDKKKPRLSRKFVTRNARVHKAIDDGRLGDAQALIDDIQRQAGLNPFELAYSRITEGRIAEARGDKARQLWCFRKAMLGHGRWVADETYVKLLFGGVILELKLEDYTSAVRDFELLTEFNSGRELANDLDEHIRAVRQFLTQGGDHPAPYMAANRVIDVERELPRRLGDETYADAGYVWIPSADKADTPPAN